MVIGSTVMANNSTSPLYVPQQHNTPTFTSSHNHRSVSVTLVRGRKKYDWTILTRDDRYLRKSRFVVTNIEDKKWSPQPCCFRSALSYNYGCNLPLEWKDSPSSNPVRLK